MKKVKVKKKEALRIEMDKLKIFVSL